MEKKKYETYVQEYQKEKMPVDAEISILAQKEREDFLDRFPVSKIRELSLEEYAFRKLSYGNKASFSTIMYSGLENIAHTGNAYTNMFGIYFKDESQQPTLSLTYSKLFGDNYKEAFSQVKEDIVKLLTEVGRDNFEAVKDCRLNSQFRYKLLAVYFPEKFLPVCTSNMMEEICNTMGVSFGNKEMVYSNIELRNIKESNPLTRDWNNSVFLGFCRWIGEKRKIDISYAEEIDDEVDSLQLQGEERRAIVKIRVNQGVFREELLKSYGKCVLCDIKKRELLIASHIKPWAESEPNEKLDVDNGFLMCPNHDRIFDKGYITFDDDGKIIISDRLTENDRVYLNVDSTMHIELTESNKKYLKFHREKVFDR